MKTKVLLLALLSGFVFSVAAQEYHPPGFIFAYRKYLT